MITLKITRLELRIINFALTFTFWMHKMHFANGTAEAEQKLQDKIKTEILYQELSEGPEGTDVSV